MGATLMLHVHWRPGAPADPVLRRKVADELTRLSFVLSRMQEVLLDADQATGAEHGYLMPRLEVRLPLYDAGRRYRVAFTVLDEPTITLLDEDGRRVADIRLP